MNVLSIVWDVDPAMFTLFGFEFRYYALTWMLAFFIGIIIFSKMVKREDMDPKLVDSIFMYSFISAILGARLGHCLFYDFEHYMLNPIQIFNFREGGLASHGAAFGMLLGLWLFSRKYRLPYIWSLDRVTTVIPAGGALIRIGNLFNSEIYGTPTDAAWGFVFVHANEVVPMHPTQIYEALIYLLIFALVMYMYFVKDQGRKYPGLIFATFLITIFGSRFFIETIKNPQVSFEESMVLNMGQILSIPFVLLGIVILVLAYKGKFKAIKN